MARVERVIPDPKAPGMYLALIQPGSYLDFANPVPFSGDDGVVERGVLNDEGRISGRAQSAVRPLSASDFHRIVGLGLREDVPVLPAGWRARSVARLARRTSTLHVRANSGAHQLPILSHRTGPDLPPDRPASLR